MLIHHAVNAEMQIVREVAGPVAPRDREAEFRITADSFDADRFRAELDAADHLLMEVPLGIAQERLEAPLERIGERIFSGLRWLIVAYGHFEEHLGEAQITKHWVMNAEESTNGE